jgi:hypothetical protein
MTAGRAVGGVVLFGDTGVGGFDLAAMKFRIGVRVSPLSGL